MTTLRQDYVNLLQHMSDCIDHAAKENDPKEVAAFNRDFSETWREFQKVRAQVQMEDIKLVQEVGYGRAIAQWHPFLTQEQRRKSAAIFREFKAKFKHMKGIV